MAEFARSAAGLTKPARSLEPLTRDATGLPADAFYNTAVLKGPLGLPRAGLQALASSAAGVKARLSGVPVNPREPFARAAAAVTPAGE